MQLRSLLPFAGLLTRAAAAPLQNAAVGPGGTLIVVNPKITAPDADAVWVVGQRYNVTWDNSALPALVNITNVQGTVVLGQFNGDGERLYLDSPLATGFFITDPSVEITVPTVPDGNYMIVLMGDSGNQSPQFKIVNEPTSSSESSSSTTSAASSASSLASSASGSPTAPTATSPGKASVTADNAAAQSSSSQTLTSPTITTTPTANGASSWFRNSLSPMGLASALIALAMAL